MGGSNPLPPPTPTPADPDSRCPLRVVVHLPNPGGLTVGQALQLLIEGVENPSLALATLNGVRLGAVAGVPDLQRLITCLLDNVPYAASVGNVGAGSVTCVLQRQGA